MKRAAMFIAGLAVLVALTWYAGAGAVGRALVSLGPGGLAVIALLHGPALALMGVAWWCAGKPVAGLSAFLGARFIRDAGAEVLPFSQLGGFAAGIRALVLAGADTLRSAQSMFADLVMEFAAKLPYTAAGLLVLFILLPGSGLLAPLAIGAAVVAAMAVAATCARHRLLPLLERAAQAAMRKWTSADLQNLRPLLAGVFSSQHLLPCFALHLLCWFLGAAETWVIFALMDVPVSPAEALVIDSLANALRTFGFFVPASAGIQEGAYVAVCALFGISPAHALAFSFARRAREIVLGLPGLALWHLMETRQLRYR